MYENLTLISAFIAILISGLSYRRSKNVDLQNQVYLKKLDAFGEIIGEFFKLLKILEDVRNEAELLILKGQSFMNDLKINQLADKVDTEIEQIHKTIGMKSIYFNEELIQEITDYLSSLYGELKTKDSDNPIPELNEYIHRQTKELDFLIDKMRKEIGLEEMNKKLTRRIKEGKINFKDLVNFKN